MPDKPISEIDNNNLNALYVGAFKLSFVYTLLFAISLPFHQPLLPNPGAWIAPLYKPIIVWMGDTVFGLQRPWTVDLQSDSTGLYLHLLLLLFISITLVFIWTMLEKKGSCYKSLRYWFRSGLSYFFAMHLLGYGFNKIFKVQFFLPEPNTLYTPVGQLSHDILFWSSMGSSYTYTVFSGVLELIPALLLLFRRTRLLGAIIGFGVMLNVLMLNVGFDISVKVFSGFLLFCAWLIISPDVRRLYYFFILQKALPSTLWQPMFVDSPKKQVYFISKTLLIGLLILNSILPYLQTGVYNDDLAPRPYLHGAYIVENFVFNGDTLTPLTSDKVRWNRIFVHRRGYFIVQNMQDQFKDFELLINKSKKILLLTDYDSIQYPFQFDYAEADSLLQLRGTWKNNRIELYAKRLDMRKLPLLNPSFHWTVDELLNGRE